jgi:hypothetical protein
VHDGRSGGALQSNAGRDPAGSPPVPDECYVLGRELLDDDFPDIALEVVISSGGINKLEVYRGLGVREEPVGVDHGGPASRGARLLAARRAFRVHGNRPSRYTEAVWPSSCSE